MRPARPLAAWGPLAVLGVIVAELVTFVAVGRLIGLGLAMLLVVLASLAGLLLLRREGLRAWRGFREAALAGRPPGPHLTDGVVGLGGASLLAVPGLLTGLTGALLLLPPVRKFARGRIQARAERQMSTDQAGEVFGPRRVRVHPADPERPPDGEVLEGEIVDRGPGA